METRFVCRNCNLQYLQLNAFGGICVCGDEIVDKETGHSYFDEVDGEQLFTTIEKQQLGNLIKYGDQMQSALSRVLDKLEYLGASKELGYETYMACSEGKSAVEHWTETRRKFGRDSS